MTTRECRKCGANSVLSTTGMRLVYQGTPSWSDLEQLYNRTVNHPDYANVCLECETPQ